MFGIKINYQQIKYSDLQAVVNEINEVFYFNFDDTTFCEFSASYFILS